MNTPLPLTIGRPATNALNATGITCLEDLARISEQELNDLHGVGPKAIDILKRTLDASHMCLLTPKNMKPKKAEIIDVSIIVQKD